MCTAKSGSRSIHQGAGKASADALVKALNENVNSIDENIAFAESDMGKKIFGAETAAGMAKKGHEVKAA